MDIGLLSDDWTQDVNANGEIVEVPGWLTEDEIIIRVATQIITRKKKKREDDAPKVKPPASIGGIRK